MLASSQQMQEAEYDNLFQSTSDHEVEREEQKEKLSARANYCISPSLL